jgi:peptide chain release factor subunit 1
MVADTVSWDQLRDLAGFRARKGCAISIFLNLDPTIAATPPETATKINSLLDEAERNDWAKRERLSHEEREGLKADFERIRRFFETDFNRDGARGFAVFVAGLDGFWRTLPLPDPVRDRVAVGPAFSLAPLAPLVGRGDGTIVAVVGRERGELFRLRAGRLAKVADRTEKEPGRHDQGGWSQARYQRHIENLVFRHLRGVAEELDALERRTGADVVVVSSEETRAEFARLLSKEVEGAIVGWTQAEAHATPAELLEVVSPVLEQARARRERQKLERWREEAGRGGRAAAGWGETLESASDARVETLLFQEGTRRQAWECPKCARASAEPGECPLDGIPFERRDDGLDLALQRTLTHGGSAWAVRQHRDLEPVEGIGALLRF